MEAGSQRGSAEEIEWLLMRGLERRAPLPDQLDLESLLSCIAEGQEEALNPEPEALRTRKKSPKPHKP